MCKLFASDVAIWVSQEGMLIHGGWGYSEEDPISRFTVDALVLPIFEGVKPILELKVIARQLLAGVNTMRDGDRIILILGDLAAFVVFGALGMASHDDGVTLKTIAPGCAAVSCGVVRHRAVVRGVLGNASGQAGALTHVG